MTSINQYEKMVLTIMDEEKVIGYLSKLLLTVMRSCVVVVAGQQVLVLDKDTNLSTHPHDSLSEREECCIPYLIEASILCRESINVWDSYKEDLMTSICRLVPDILIPVFATMNVTAKIFGIFGWGKRKRNTKVAAASLADVASCLHDLIVSIKKRVVKSDDDIECNDDISGKVFESSNVIEMLSGDVLSMMDSRIEKVLHNISENERTLRSRLSIILTQMEIEYSSFEEAD
jgi:hypothetical protein